MPLVQADVLGDVDRHLPDPRVHGPVAVGRDAGPPEQLAVLLGHDHGQALAGEEPRLYVERGAVLGLERG
jgi:hypothetical protein